MPTTPDFVSYIFTTTETHIPPSQLSKLGFSKINRPTYSQATKCKYKNLADLSIWRYATTIAGFLSLEQAQNIMSLLIPWQNIKNSTIEFCQKTFATQTNINLESICDVIKANNEIYDLKFSQHNLIFKYGHVKINISSGGKVILRGLKEIPTQDTVRFVHTILGIPTKRSVVVFK